MNEQLKAIAVKAKVEHCISHVRLQEFADLLEKEFEAKYFSEGYLRGQADGIKDTVLSACNKIESEYKYALGEKTQWAMAQDIQDLLRAHFGIEE